MILLVSEFNFRIIFNYIPQILDNQVFRDNVKNQCCFNVSHNKLPRNSVQRSNQTG